MPKIVYQLSAADSTGIHRYCCCLANALQRIGVESRVVEKPQQAIGEQALLHVHFGNSARNFFPLLAARRPLVVTVHDIIPRDPRIRPILAPLQARLLRRHCVVVHSNHSAELLRKWGGPQPTAVIHHGTTAGRILNSTCDALREELGIGSAPYLLAAGVLKTAKKIPALIQAAHRFNSAHIVLAGKVADRRTAQAISQAPPNVSFVDNPDNDRFRTLLGCATMLLHLRTESVGEVSGPVVEAHGLGTPVAGYSMGFMSEYRDEHDLLFPPSTGIEHCIEQTIQAIDPKIRVSEDSPSITHWKDAARQYSELYAL